MSRIRLAGIGAALLAIICGAADLFSDLSPGHTTSLGIAALLFVIVAVILFVASEPYELRDEDLAHAGLRQLDPEDPALGLNALARYGDGPLIPVRQDGGHFYDPAGVKIVRPDAWFPATPDVIKTELGRQGAVMIGLR